MVIRHGRGIPPPPHQDAGSHRRVPPRGPGGSRTRRAESPCGSSRGGCGIRYGVGFGTGRRLAACLLALLLAAGCARRAPSGTSTRAGTAAAALQQRYYRSGRWLTAGYWQNAQAFSIVLDEYQRTGSAQWRADITEVYRANSRGAIGDFNAPYVDDEGWWALDWIRAWDLTGNPAYLSTAKAIFRDMSATWDTACGGGVWWNHTKTYKNAIPNELFLLVADELHEVTPGDAGAGSYLWWAQREAAWFEGSGLINARGQVNDGLTFSCFNNGGTPWTYNQGVILAGMAELAHITGDKAYLHLAERIADAEVRYGTTPGGVLYEAGCEPNNGCGSDGPLFKGIFIRYLWWLYAYAPQPAYRALITASQDSLWNHDRTPGNLFGLHWAGPAPQPGQINVEDDIAGTMAFTSVSVAAVPRPRRGPAA